MDKSLIKTVIDSFKDLRILVIGDVMLDHYSYGKVDRISPEAPVPIIHLIDESFVPGGAGNVYLNISAMGAEVTLISVLGKDAGAENLLHVFKKTPYSGKQVFFFEQDRKTTVKQRLIAGGQQLLRVDTEDRYPITRETEFLVSSYLNEHGNEFDCICVSDYAKGMITANLAQEICACSKHNDAPVIVDTKPSQFKLYNRCTLITPNELEVTSAYADLNLDYVESARRLSLETNSPILVTRGEQGMSYITGNESEQFSIPSFATDVRDVSGAGDTVVALCTLGLASNLNVYETSVLASKAAAVAISKYQSSVVTPGELLDSL